MTSWRDKRGYCNTCRHLLCECTPSASPDVSQQAREFAEREWTGFLDANPDDITSPEEWPDHALITFDQVWDYLIAPCIERALSRPADGIATGECQHKWVNAACDGNHYVCEKCPAMFMYDRDADGEPLAVDREAVLTAIKHHVRAVEGWPVTIDGEDDAADAILALLAPTGNSRGEAGK